MYGKSITKNDYFLKFIYANTNDMNCHLIKNNLQKYIFQEEKYMSTWNNLQSKLCIIEIGFIWGKNRKCYM